MILNMPGTIGSAKIIMKPPLEKIGIIGLGFVGGAIKASIDWGDDLWVVIDPSKGFNSTYQELAKETEGVFVCVPTPMGDDGVCDTSFLEDVLKNLKAVNYEGVIISKCTAPPAVYEKLNAEHANLVHAPEFLTAANANRDYVNGKFSIIGGRVNAYIREAERIIKNTQPNLQDILHCTIGEAALAKYTINSFLATKVAFMNEIYEIASEAGMNYDTIRHAVTLDSRIGMTHMQVPGPDGSFGFGGACFPKDTSALLKYAETLNKTPMVLDAAVKKNTLLRLR